MDTVTIRSKDLAALIELAQRAPKSITEARFLEILLTQPEKSEKEKEDEQVLGRV